MIMVRYAIQDVMIICKPLDSRTDFGVDTIISIEAGCRQCVGFGLSPRTTRSVRVKEYRTTRSCLATAENSGTVLDHVCRDIQKSSEVKHSSPTLLSFSISTFFVWERERDAQKLFSQLIFFNSQFRGTVIERFNLAITHIALGSKQSLTQSSLLLSCQGAWETTKYTATLEEDMLSHSTTRAKIGARV